MRRLLHAYASLFVAIAAAFRTPRVHALLSILLLIAFAQALVFSYLEGWSFLDSFYFGVVSMSTVGYGDFVPHTSLGKIATIAFLVVGIGVFVATVTSVAHEILRALISAERLDAQPAPPKATVAGEPERSADARDDPRGRIGRKTSHGRDDHVG